MLKLSILIALFSMSFASKAADTCSRVATINYQEVLVDVSSNNRGEGLRYYLQKDEVSKELLDEYQDNNRPTWKSAALSTLGSAMILGGILKTGDSDKDTITNKNFLLFGGLSLMGISYVISKTNAYNNEYLLIKSVEEYNKRNTPRIFFAPTDLNNGAGFGAGVSQEF